MTALIGAMFIGLGLGLMAYERVVTGFVCILIGVPMIVVFLIQSLDGLLLEAAR